MSYKTVMFFRGLLLILLVPVAIKSSHYLHQSFFQESSSENVLILKSNNIPAKAPFLIHRLLSYPQVSQNKSALSHLKPSLMFLELGPAEEERYAAYHEAAHTVTAWRLNDSGIGFIKASIIPGRSGPWNYLGYVSFANGKDYTNTETQLRNRMSIYLAGGVATELWWYGQRNDWINSKDLHETLRCAYHLMVDSGRSFADRKATRAAVDQTIRNKPDNFCNNTKRMLQMLTWIIKNRLFLTGL